MDKIINFLNANYTWLFSGLGVFIIAFFIKRKFFHSINQKMKSGDNSISIQTKGNVDIKVNEKESKHK